MLLPLLLNNLLSEAGEPPVPDPTPEQTPSGRSRRHRQRAYVEIDGQKFIVSSQSEAELLLQQARAIAERQAEKPERSDAWCGDEHG